MSKVPKPANYKGGTYLSGPVIVHKDDGATLLVSRTDIHPKQKFWVSAEDVER